MSEILYKTIMEQKCNLKEKICEEIDRYYAQYQQPGQNITIDDIEQFLVSSKEKMQNLINEATPDILETQQDICKKKRAPHVERTT